MMQRTVMAVLASLAALLSGSMRSGAQTVERDPSTGAHRVTYTALDGNEYTVVVRAHDNVAPVVSVSIERRNEAFVYRYTLKHLRTPTAEPGIGSFHLRCPFEDPALSMRHPSSWRAWSDTTGGRRDCSFAPAGAPLPPGQEVTGLELVSGWLPQISVARVQGLAGVTVLESEEDTPPEVVELVNDLMVRPDAGTGRGVLTLVPSWLTAGSWIALILGDLDESCELGWIDDSGVCGGLRSQLERARAAARTETIREHLLSFLAELEAEHGSEPGKHVNDNAYWLLKTNAEFAFPASPQYSIGVILHDLDEVCELRWIYPEVCDSLRTKLERARAALEDDDVESAHRRSQSFLAELEGEHESGPGKRVNDNAYWLLKTNVEFVLSRF